MPDKPWQPNVRHTRPGEEVRAGVDGRPTRDLEDRTGYLRDVLDAAEASRALFDNGQTLAPGLPVGTPVYWDPENSRYAAAYAAWGVDATTGVVAPSAPAGVVGLIYSKTNDTLGKVLLLGRVSELDLSAVVVGGVVTPGFLWLSGDEGKLTTGPVPTGPLVAMADGAGGVFVLPNLRNFAEDHVHYKYDLPCRPAGLVTPPSEGDRHTIDESNEGETGWLPADHPTFSGRAPSGAVFGYNLREDGRLSRVWPPVPLSSAVLVWDKGRGAVGGTEVPLGRDGLVVVDRNGIWWMSDCYGDVPWPIDATGGESSSSSSAGSSAECPRSESMKLTLYFARMTFATDKTVVSSLKAAEGSAIRVLNCDGDTASTGELILDLDGAFATEGVEAEGHVVLKSQEGTKFLRGPVVEGLIAHSDESVVLTSTAPRTTSSGVVHQGTVTVQANLEPGERLLLTQVVDLTDVRQRNYSDVLALGFPAGQDSEIRVKLAVPATGLPAGPKVKIRILVWGRTAGTLPDLGFSYRRLPRPDGLTPTALPLSDTAGTLTTAAAVAADEYVEAETGGFTVTAGDTVQFTLSRTSADAYAGEVLVLDLVGVLYPG